MAYGVTVEELARRSGLSPAFVAYLESGRTEPAWRDVEKIAVGMGLPLRAFEKNDGTA
jgi:transcriptional regulator with XRE-family HTH domain